MKPLYTKNTNSAKHCQKNFSLTYFKKTQQQQKTKTHTCQGTLVTGTVRQNGLKQVQSPFGTHSDTVVPRLQGTSGYKANLLKLASNVNTLTVNALPTTGSKVGSVIADDQNRANPDGYMCKTQQKVTWKVDKSSEIAIHKMFESSGTW